MRMVVPIALFVLGKTQNLEGENRRIQVDLAILHGFGAIVGQAGAPEPSGGEAGPTRVRFQPPGGVPITYVFDASTGLPASAELAVSIGNWGYALRRRDTRGTNRPQHAQIVEFDFRAILRRWLGVLAEYRAAVLAA